MEFITARIPRFFIAAAILFIIQESSINQQYLLVNAEVCNLCPNETHAPLGGNRTKFLPPGGGNYTTCSDAEELAPTGFYSNCTTLHNIAAEICECGIPSNKKFQCPLCGGDGKELPFPDRVVADKTCQQWQNKAHEDFEMDCIAWQKSFGSYCGCDISDPFHFDGFCRICNDTILSKPNRSVSFQGNNEVYTKHCAWLEQDLNTRSGFDCERDVQNVYSTHCDCGWEIEQPSRSPNSNNLTSSGTRSRLKILMSFFPLGLLVGLLLQGGGFK
jgi:hypothetical protein|eukprot:scaffold5831_cov203-Chaetoceros_neogracile.AAC.2